MSPRVGVGVGLKLVLELGQVWVLTGSGAGVGPCVGPGVDPGVAAGVGLNLMLELGQLWVMEYVLELGQVGQLAVGTDVHLSDWELSFNPLLEYSRGLEPFGLTQTHCHGLH